jgi:hypothetical protein
VARDRDELFAGGAAHRFRDGGRSNLGDLPIHNAREFVDDDERPRIEKRARKRGAKLLPVRQHVKRLQPPRRGGEADRRERRGDVANRKLGVERVDEASGLVPVVTADERVGKEGLRGRALAGARGADDETDLPVAFGDRHVEVKARRLALRFGDIEHALELRHAGRALDVNHEV